MSILQQKGTELTLHFKAAAASLRLCSQSASGRAKELSMHANSSGRIFSKTESISTRDLVSTCKKIVKHSVTAVRD